MNVGMNYRYFLTQRFRFILVLCTGFSFTFIATENFGAEKKLYDLVIYGPTSAGVAAAVQAQRMGLDVIVTGPDAHLGGLSAGGLGWTDSGNKEVIGGISLEFYKRVYAYYDKPETWTWQTRTSYGKRGQGTQTRDGHGRAMWVFEPHVAEQIFEDLVHDHMIPIDRNQWLDRSEKGVTKKNRRIVSIRMKSGKVYEGKMFIDATYEGDLMAAAGVSYTVGREGNNIYGETLNGVQVANAKSHQFVNKVNAYQQAGDSRSGLLPRIQPEDPGIQGQGDHRIQAYNFRMCLTRVKENRVSFSKPKNYDPSQYELLLRELLAGSRHITGKFDMLPNLKTDTNNHGSFSTDNIGMNYDYPDATYKRRQEIITEHRTYQQGYCYFLSNDPRVPSDVRKWYSKWGFAKDEFTDNDHWPHQIYVREARRMIGDFVVTENHLRQNIPTTRPIGMGSYNMDSHHVQRYVDDNGFVHNEGDVQVNPGAPYPIDYGAMTPQKKECTNLLVVCAVSSSHIAYGSIRMEPVFMILGQSATTAAAQALRNNQAVQDIAYETLAKRLVADGQVLTYDQYQQTKHAIPVNHLEGFVVDDEDSVQTGKWTHSKTVGHYIHRGYQHDDNTGKGGKTATFETSLKPGNYDVQISYSAHPNRATNVPITIHHRGGHTTTFVNQTEAPDVNGLFVSVGSFEFGERGVVDFSNHNTDGYVILDAVNFVPKNE